MRDTDTELYVSSDCVRLEDTVFDLGTKRVKGPANEDTEKLRDELRRRGIRFYSRPFDGRYLDWA